MMAVNVVLRNRGHEAAVRTRHFAQWGVQVVFIVLVMRFSFLTFFSIESRSAKSLRLSLLCRGLRGEGRDLGGDGAAESREV